MADPERGVAVCWAAEGTLVRRESEIATAAEERRPAREPGAEAGPWLRLAEGRQTATTTTRMGREGSRFSGCDGARLSSAGQRAR